MAPMVTDRRIHAITVDEVMRMAEHGVLDDGERLELLHGQLVEKVTKSPGHEAVKSRLFRWLAPDVARGAFDVRVEAPLYVPDRTSLPEPDVVLVEPGGEVDHPRRALLVIEVAVTSLRTDVEVKAPLLAAGGTPEYWVVDVPARRVIVFSEPGPDGYLTRTTRQATPVRPTRVDVAPLDLDALFAGLR